MKIMEKGLAGLVLRSGVGGVLMGLANLVPGISGGTMLLAAGVYPSFINAVAEVTTFKFKLRSLLVLGSVVCAAGIAILLLAGTVKDLVVDHRWIMYSLFIGLTLGGIPVVWQLIDKACKAVALGAVAGFIGMALLACCQQSGITGTGSGASSFLLLFFAGLAGASAMILPGVSGGYLLLVLGQYVVILTAVDALKVALSAGDMTSAIHVALSVCLPVGLGVVVGIAVVSNVLRVLLLKFKNATLGVLLGLLIGAVVGLWPFQQGVMPEVGDTIKGRVMTEMTLAELDHDDYPTRYFKPSVGRMAISVGIIFAGFAATFMISRFGKTRE